jgi:hypothetical protein
MILDLDLKRLSLFRIMVEVICLLPRYSSRGLSE